MFYWKRCKPPEGELIHIGTVTSTIHEDRYILYFLVEGREYAVENGSFFSQTERKEK